MVFAQQPAPSYQSVFTKFPRRMDLAEYLQDASEVARGKQGVWMVIT
jgi:hypothetical protein